MELVVALVLLLGGSYVYSVPQGVADQRALIINTEAKPHDSTHAVVRTFSVLRGNCGCFDFAGDTLVYKSGNACDSVLLCRMFHNIAIIHGLHLKMAGNFMTKFPVVSEVQNMKPTEDVDFKNMDISCLSRVLQKDVPSLLKKLQNLLCLFHQGKDEHNEALYKEFLTQLNMVLKNVGCSLDEVLKTKNVLEQVADNAGKIAHQLVFEILKIADNLELTGKLLNVVCKLLGKTLSSLSDVLGNVGLGVKTIGGGLLG